MKMHSREEKGATRLNWWGWLFSENDDTYVHGDTGKGKDEDRRLFPWHVSVELVAVFVPFSIQGREEKLIIIIIEERKKQRGDTLSAWKICFSHETPDISKKGFSEGLGLKLQVSHCSWRVWAITVMEWVLVVVVNEFLHKQHFDE